MHLFAAASAAATCLAATAAAHSATSMQMLDSIVARHQGIIDSGAASSTLESGILAQAIAAVITDNPSTKSRYAPFLTRVLDVASSKGLTNCTYASLRPLDRFALATGIQWAIDSREVTVSPQTLEAHAAISASFAMQKRNPDGGMWYYVYPEWSYLDGMFSVLPYMAAQPNADYHDMMLQINLLREHCTQSNSSLLVHGYDWSRKAVWADKKTGASQYVWGRSLAWFLAGLVQTWDRLSCDEGKSTFGADPFPVCQLIQNTTTQVSTALLKYADPTTGAWWQLVTLPGQPGNYLESSSTALFVFSLLKALRSGLLPQEDGPGPKFKRAALKAYKYTKDNFVTFHGVNGTIGFNKTVSVCSLNSTATYEYYTKQPLVPNSLLGESAYILASLEVERLRR
ncbi:hypothetical protein E4U55_005820 [Claviceps digitariae]|nr:hypothetical protein E4U55_005820 [Claviceps digitariae]